MSPEESLLVKMPEEPMYHPSEKALSEDKEASCPLIDGLAFAQNFLFCKVTFVCFVLSQNIL